MQRVTIEVQNSFMPDFLLYLASQKDKISLTQDRNLELDPYFYQRQRKLQKIRDDVKSGKMKMLSQEESDREIELFFQKLENSED